MVNNEDWYIITDKVKYLPENGRTVSFTWWKRPYRLCSLCQERSSYNDKSQSNMWCIMLGIWRSCRSWIINVCRPFCKVCQQMRKGDNHRWKTIHQHLPECVVSWLNAVHGRICTTRSDIKEEINRECGDNIIISDVAYQPTVVCFHNTHDTILSDYWYVSKEQWKWRTPDNSYDRSSHSKGRHTITGVWCWKVPVHHQQTFWMM